MIAMLEKLLEDAREEAEADATKKAQCCEPLRSSVHVRRELGL